MHRQPSGVLAGGRYTNYSFVDHDNTSQLQPPPPPSTQERIQNTKENKKEALFSSLSYHWRSIPPYSTSATMNSMNNQPTLRRVKKFASSSVLDSNYTNAGAPPTPNLSQSSLRTLVNITNHPLNHTRSRSQSQSQFEGPKFPVHNHQTQRFARKAQSQATIHVKQHATIESLISNPPASLVEALQDLRYLILTEGVTADMDGNVRGRCYSCFTT